MGTVLERGAGPLGIHHRGEPPRRRPLEPELVTERGAQGEQSPGVVAVVVVGGAVRLGRAHRQPGGVHVGVDGGAEAVGGGDDVAVVVVVIAHGDPVGIGQRGDQPVTRLGPDLPPQRPRQPRRHHRDVVRVLEHQLGATLHRMRRHPALRVIGPRLRRRAIARAGGGGTIRSELLTARRAVEPVRRDHPPRIVEHPTQHMTPVIHQPRQPPRRIVLIDVDRTTIAVRHHRAVARVIAERDLPTERRHLGEHPALAVETVTTQTHPVRVPHLHDAAPVIGHIRPVPHHPLTTDQVPHLVIAVTGPRPHDDTTPETRAPSHSRRRRRPPSCSTLVNRPPV